MAHEHLLKAHIYLHTASGDTPDLEYRRLHFICNVWICNSTAYLCFLAEDIHSKIIGIIIELARNSNTAVLFSYSLKNG